jgi:hypothetical protein
MNSYTVEVLVFVDSDSPDEAKRVVTEVIASGIGRIDAAWTVSDVRSDDE